MSYMRGNQMTQVGELGEFLRSRRARVRPEQLGLATYGQRRVPGLRREELAQLAGISVTYYTRLEQGQSVNASESVINAIARALGLTEDERLHLQHLARPKPVKRQVPPEDTVRPGIQQLVEAMTTVPAVLLSRRNDVLAWNRMAHRLLAGHYDFHAPQRPQDRPNLTWMLFLDPHTRELFRHWQEEAARAVASLRLVAGRYPDDPGLAALIGELSVKSDEFAELWSKHPVYKCVSGTKYLRHPEVGDFELQYEVLHLPDDNGHRLMTYTAVPDSPAEAALLLLGRHPERHSAVP